MRSGKKRKSKDSIKGAVLQVKKLEFDQWNSSHIEEKGIHATFIDFEILADRPRFAHNPPSADRSATHIMVGKSSTKGVWTVPIVAVDAEMGLWRPVTAYPSSPKQVKFWETGR